MKERVIVYMGMLGVDRVCVRAWVLRGRWEALTGISIRLAAAHTACLSTTRSPASMSPIMVHVARSATSTYGAFGKKYHPFDCLLNPITPNCIHRPKSATSFIFENICSVQNEEWRMMTRERLLRAEVVVPCFLPRRRGS